MKKIAIIGLGLIGGSLAMSLKRAGYYVLGIPHRHETIEAALNANAISSGSLEIEAVSAADVVFICTPISIIIPKIKEMLPHLKPGTIVTDVGSTKAEIVEKAEKLMSKGMYFVGGHPMAGKEKVKFEAAEDQLFRDKTWILTKTKKTNLKALSDLEEMIKKTGANIITLDPKTHDLVVAGISHAPLAIAAALVNMVSNSREKDLMAKCAASGFSDTTRIASGDPALGLDMFTTNKKAILQMIKLFRSSLQKLESAIKSGNKKKIEHELVKAKTFKNNIFHKIP